MNTNLSIMEGILYLTDDQNKKKYVQIDLDKYGEIWEDFYDDLKAKMIKDEIIGYESDGSPITATEFINQSNQAIERVRQGKEGISVEELQKRSKEWLSHMK